MDRLSRLVLVGAVTVLVTIASIYAYLDAAERRVPPLDPEVVQGCRSLVREAAEILVQAAQDDLVRDDPASMSLLADLQGRLAEIEEGMDTLRCEETSERWAYGSFVQEMSEYEEYIAELARGNARGVGIVAPSAP